METKFDNHNKNNDIILSTLLPIYFKKIGLAIMIFSFLPLVISKITSFDIPVAQKETIKYLVMNFFILGMLLIAWSKNKIEDDLTVALRIKSVVYAFILAVFFVIFKPISDMFLGSPVSDLNGQDIAFIMVSFYLLSYFFQRKALRTKT